MRDHPRILIARMRVEQPAARILGKDVSSWMEYEQPNTNEVEEGGRRMSQRNKEKEGKSTITKYNNYNYRGQDPCQDKDIFSGGGPAGDERGRARGDPREEGAARPGTVSYK